MAVFVSGSSSTTSDYHQVSLQSTPYSIMVSHQHLPSGLARAVGAHSGMPLHVHVQYADELMLLPGCLLESMHDFYFEDVASVIQRSARLIPTARVGRVSWIWRFDLWFGWVQIPVPTHHPTHVSLEWLDLANSRTSFLGPLVSMQIFYEGRPWRGFLPHDQALATHLWASPLPTWQHRW